MRRLYPTPSAIDGSAGLEAEYFVPGRHRHLRADFVVSLDGAVEIGRTSRALSGEADRAAFFAMRAVADVVLVGAGTVRAENYGPPRADAELSQRRRDRGQRPIPALAVVTDRADLEPDARIFGGEEPPLLRTTAAAARARTDLAAVAEIVVCGEAGVDLHRAIDALQTRNLGRILCEGGPGLLRSLLDAKLVDEMCLTLSPVLAGPERRGLTGDRAFADPIGLELISVLEGGGMLLTRYGRADRS
jgi:riboflavin biosynthesis pyrimidine reductase